MSDCCMVNISSLVQANVNYVYYKVNLSQYLQDNVDSDYYMVNSVAVLPGSTEGPCPPPPSWPASNCMGAHLYLFNGTNKLFCHDLCNFLSKYTIEPDSCVPLFMVCHFQSIIQYTTRKSLLEMTSGPENSIMIHRRRTLHRFKLREYAPLVNLFIFNFSAVQTSKTSFQFAEECTIKRPRFHFFSQQFQLLKHRFKLRQHAPFSNLVLKCSSSVPTSENIESIALVCTSQRP